jgi:hypothetical protein
LLTASACSICYNVGVRLQTSIKVAIAGIVLFLFGAFIFRAALRLASTAMHSLLGTLVLLGVVVWILASTRRR